MKVLGWCEVFGYHECDDECRECVGCQKLFAITPAELEALKRIWFGLGQESVSIDAYNHLEYDDFENYKEDNYAPYKKGTL